MPTPDRVHIFDTTLRDGEQAPGCSMTMTEKLRMAHKLAELGVDIMEAGFPIASTGDFEAVQKVSREVSIRVAALARATALDVERAAKALEGAKSSPRIHVFLATSDVHLKYKLKKTRAQVLDEAAAAVALARKYVGDVEFSAEDGGRTPVEYLIEVSRGRRCRGHHRQHPRHRRLRHPRGVRRAHRSGRGRARAVGHRQRPLPQRSRAGRRQLAQRHPERRAPGGVHGQRHR
jgi:hypothetical protein